MNKEWAHDRLNQYLAAKEIMRRLNPHFEEYKFVMNGHTEALTLTIQTLALITDAEELSHSDVDQLLCEVAER